jgi:hypothetical protein
MPKKKPKVITKEQFDRWSPSHQQRALADKRTRIRIETRALPKEWRERRERALRNRTPITPGSSTTYGDLAKQQKYMEALTFGEGDRQLADRTTNLADARTRDADWFRQYREQVMAAQDKAIQAQANAVAGNQAFIQSANQVSESSRNAIQQQLRDRAAQLGQADQAGEYGQLADQAAASRAALLATGAQKQVNDANTNVNMRTEAVGTASLKDLEAQGYRTRQESALTKDKGDYATKKGAWREKFINDAISEARKQVLENAAYQLRAQDTAADNARADAAAAETRRNNRNRQSNADRNYALQREKYENPNRAPRSPKRERRTGAQNIGVKSKISRAENWGRILRSKGMTQSQIRDVLLTGRTVKHNGEKKKIPPMDRDVVNTAMDIVYLGYIGKTNRRVWQRAGYNVKSWGWPLKTWQKIIGDSIDAVR